MQIKLGHGFFKSYLIRLSNYDSQNCNELYNEKQTSKYLLLFCHYIDERQNLIKNMQIPILLRTLFNTVEGTKNTIKFLKDNKICMRK